MPAERFDFANAQGEKLAALLDRPDGPIRAVALFAHCFTCGKDNKAARLIAHGLTSHGIAVLRFDFTGLGGPYVAHVIAAWAERYLEMTATPPSAAEAEPHDVLVRETRDGTFQQEITAGTHCFLADEPVAAGGLDSGPGPYDLLLAALGACTSMTLRLYADRKKLALLRTRVRLRHSRIYATDCAECETKEGMLDRINRVISFEGELDAETRERLLEIADKCPVHRTLTSEIDIRTTEESGQSAAR